MELARFPVLCETSFSHIVVPYCPGVQSHQRLKLKHLIMEVPLAVAWFGAVSHKRSVGLMLQSNREVFLDYLFV